jgi:hypothetical protein
MTIQRATKDLQDYKPAPAPVIKYPEEMIAPGAGDPSLLTRSPSHKSSAADDAPPAGRPGQDNNLEHPSRMGDRLVYRNGRVTDMRGQPIHNDAPQ